MFTNLGVIWRKLKAKTMPHPALQGAIHDGKDRESYLWLPALHDYSIASRLPQPFRRQSYSIYDGTSPFLYFSSWRLPLNVLLPVYCRAVMRSFPRLLLDAQIFGPKEHPFIVAHLLEIAKDLKSLSKEGMTCEDFLRVSLRIRLMRKEGPDKRSRTLSDFNEASWNALRCAAVPEAHREEQSREEKKLWPSLRPLLNLADWFSSVAESPSLLKVSDLRDVRPSGYAAIDGAIDAAIGAFDWDRELLDALCWALDKDIASGGGSGLPLWPADQKIPQNIIIAFLSLNRELSGKLSETDLMQMRSVLAGDQHNLDAPSMDTLLGERERHSWRDVYVLYGGHCPMSNGMPHWPIRAGSWDPSALFFSILASQPRKELRDRTMAVLAARAVFRIAPFWVSLLRSVVPDSWRFERMALKAFEWWSIILNENAETSEKEEAERAMRMELTPLDPAAWCAVLRPLQLETMSLKIGTPAIDRNIEISLPDGGRFTLSSTEIYKRAAGVSLSFDRRLAYGQRAIHVAARAITCFVHSTGQKGIGSELAACAADAIELSALSLYAESGMDRWEAHIPQVSC